MLIVLLLFLPNFQSPKYENEKFVTLFIYKNFIWECIILNIIVG